MCDLKNARRAPRRSAVFAALALVVVSATWGLAYSRPGRTDRMSVSTSGQQTTGSFSIHPVISANGRFVVFGSDSPTLVPGDTNGTWDVFVRDRWFNITERVSVASGGGEANGASSRGSNGYRADISADGRYVAFVSDASNLVVDDSNGSADAFVHDRLTGKTELVSVNTEGKAGNGASLTPTISADGRFVAFTSAATDLAAGDTNGLSDVLVRDRTQKTTRIVSKSPSGAIGNGNSLPAAVSANGRYVLFESASTNLVSGDTNGTADVFIRDLTTGAIERVSVATDGSQALGTSHSGELSADGRFVVFRSDATNLVPSDTNGIASTFGGSDIFVRDRVRGRTERVSVRSDGTEAAPGVSIDPAISDDGRYIAFESEVTDLVPGDTNELVDVFVYDRLMAQIERTSINSVNAQSNGHSLTASSDSEGRLIAFSSDSGNLVGGDTNGRRDIFVRDRGPDIGIGGLAGAPFDSFLGRKVTASGWATFTGAVLAAAEDPDNDGTNGAGDSGAELVGASFLYRGEQEDVLLRLDMRELSPIGGTCGKGVPCPVALGRPGVLYGAEFSVAGGSRYEIRAMRAAGTSVPPSTPYFGLYRCEQQSACVEVAKLSGSIGTAGEDVRVVLPLGVLGVQPGSSLRGLRAFTAVGEASSGTAGLMDQVLLGDVDVPVRTVLLGVAAPNVPLHQVAFTTTANLDKGSFSATLSAPGGQFRLWANACLGIDCAASSVLVEPAS